MPNFLCYFAGCLLVLNSRLKRYQKKIKGVSNSWTNNCSKLYQE